VREVSYGLLLRLVRLQLRQPGLLLQLPRLLLLPHHFKHLPRSTQPCGEVACTVHNLAIVLQTRKKLKSCPVP